MAAQREDAAAGAPDIAEQKLQDRSRANDLHADRVLRPTNRIANSGGLIRTGRGNESLRRLQKNLFRNAARAFDQLRRVAREVALQHLVDATRILQSRI